MLASELKKQYFKKDKAKEVFVVGHLTSCVKDGKDLHYHIHNDEEIPHNVGVSFAVWPQYQDHWRDNPDYKMNLVSDVGE